MTGPVPAAQLACNAEDAGWQGTSGLTPAPAVPALPVAAAPAAIGHPPLRARAVLQAKASELMLPDQIAYGPPAAADIACGSAAVFACTAAAAAAAGTPPGSDAESPTCRAL